MAPCRHLQPNHYGMHAITDCISAERLTAALIGDSLPYLSMMNCSWSILS